MKKIIALFTAAIVLTCSTPLFAQMKSSEAGPAKRDTVFNRCSDFFDTFDRPFKRPGNKQNFFTATSEWLKNINKE